MKNYMFWWKMTKIDNFLRPDPKTDNFKTDNFLWPAGISGGRPESQSLLDDNNCGLEPRGEMLALS